MIFLCAIDIYSKYAWAISLKDKERILDKSKRKPNKILVEKGSGFYNRSKRSWLGKNAIEMYLAYNEGKSVVAERNIRTFKNKIYKCMTSVSKMCILIN